MAKSEMIPGGPLPSLYAKWMWEFLKAPLPAEIRATCEKCPMIEERTPVCKADVLFHKKTKCCSFMPEIPNYLAGAILSDDSAETSAGRNQFERGALARAVINPLGVFPTPEYSMIYRFNSTATFGTREGLRCPYYMEEAGGLCGIWKYRNGRCSTWFCKHERGSVSVIFWKYLDRLLAEIEKSLSQWCILQVDLGSRALAHLIPASGDAVRGTTAVWGKWAGKEREYFIECSKRVRELTWGDLQEIVGPETQVLSRLTLEAFHNWQKMHLPATVRCGGWNTERIGNGRVRVWTFSPFDPLEIESATLEAFRKYEGQPVRNAVERIQIELGVVIEDSLLQRLFDVQILLDE